LKDGSVHQFNSTGKLLSLADRNNNQTTLSYDASGHLASITNPFGRVLNVTTNANGQVLFISDQLGTVATYAYGAGNTLSSVTYADNSGFQFAYDGSDRLTTVTDALGSTVESHTYDGQGRAITSERQGGVERYTLSYVSDTETDVTDALGHVTKYFFDKSKGRNFVTRVEGVCGCGGGAGSQVQTWTYDNQLNVTSKTDALNHTVSYTYDADGNTLTVTNTLGTTTFTYNSLGQILTGTDSIGRIATYAYDVKGNLVSAKDALNNETTFAYGQHGLLQTVTDARQKVTSFSYDSHGNLTQKMDAANNATAFTYDARNRPVSRTDALNHTSSVEYDQVGRIKKVIAPDSTFYTYAYNLAGRRTGVTDARNNTTSYGYDSADRLTSIMNADNKVTTFSYDLMSNLLSVTDALNRTTDYEYDEFNRLKKTIYPAATTGATRLESRVEYDLAGNVKKQIDTAGRETVDDYDAVNRLIKVTDPALQTTQYEYNARSEMATVVDALSQRYEFAHDAVGRVTNVTRGGHSMSYGYDTVGNRTSRTDYNGATNAYAYDNLNRLATITYPDTTTASYAYDALSRLSSATNAAGTVTFSYDNRSRVSSTTDVCGKTVAYGYDANSNRTSLQMGGRSITYAYDVLNRLTEITENNQSVNYSYDAANQLVTRSLPNSLTTSYEYDRLGRLARQLTAPPYVPGPHPSVTSDRTYQYDSASQISQVEESYTQWPVSFGLSHSYSYDALSRLTNAEHSNIDNEEYAYDAVGNRTLAHRVGGYQYEPFNKLISVESGQAYSYDANGNLVAKTDSSGNSDLQWQYGWDSERRLTSVNLPEGAGAVTYSYDALGRRVSRASDVSGETTHYNYDGEDVISDDSSGGRTVEYLNGLGVDDKLRLKDSQLGTYYFTQDHLGSTRELTDEQGNVSERIEYDSFGNGEGSSLTRYGYTSREWDAETGLYYYRNRWYDPSVGRFISEDPIGLSGGVNWYAYVANNPIRFADPLGLQREDARWQPGELEWAENMRRQMASWTSPPQGCGCSVLGPPLPSSPNRGYWPNLPKGKVYLCSRVAHIPLNFLGFRHYWIKTDSKEAGLGAAGAGVPGQAGSGDYPGVPTTINDHTGECFNPETECVEVPGADPNAINQRLQIGTYQGPWIPMLNDCRSFACNTLYPPLSSSSGNYWDNHSWGGGGKGW
jgi:RHS repeat-associated protein